MLKNIKKKCYLFSRTDNTIINLDINLVVVFTTFSHIINITKFIINQLNMKLFSQKADSLVLLLLSYVLQYIHQLSTFRESQLNTPLNIHLPYQLQTIQIHHSLFVVNFPYLLFLSYIANILLIFQSTKFFSIKNIFFIPLFSINTSNITLSDMLITPSIISISHPAI